MNLIDLRTVLRLAGVMGGLMSLALYSLKRNYPASIKGLGEWSAALLLLFVSGLLFSGRGKLPDYASITFSNFLLWFQFFALVGGLSHLCWQPALLWRQASPGAVDDLNHGGVAGIGMVHLRRTELPGAPGCVQPADGIPVWGARLADLQAGFNLVCQNTDRRRVVRLHRHPAPAPGHILPLARWCRLPRRGTLPADLPDQLHIFHSAALHQHGADGQRPLAHRAGTPGHARFTHQCPDRPAHGRNLRGGTGALPPAWPQHGPC